MRSDTSVWRSSPGGVSLPHDLGIRSEQGSGTRGTNPPLILSGQSRIGLKLTCISPSSYTDSRSFLFTGL
ncbi:MAG: hypothetical protein C4530_02900 [Desulfobacteraceae bacterium]|nr:MAG: hypothetical protein C4530_02900 [Desulfobacteraceae bacterium]